MSQVPEFEVVSLKEIRYDLAEFFRQIDAGRKFIVYSRSKPIVRVGKVGDSDESGVIRKKIDRFDVGDQTSTLLEIVNNTWLEMRLRS